MQNLSLLKTPSTAPIANSAGCNKPNAGSTEPGEETVSFHETLSRQLDAESANNPSKTPDTESAQTIKSRTSGDAPSNEEVSGQSESGNPSSDTTEALNPFASNSKGIGKKMHALDLQKTTKPDDEKSKDGSPDQPSLPPALAVMPVAWQPPVQLAIPSGKATNGNSPTDSATLTTALSAKISDQKTIGENLDSSGKTEKADTITNAIDSLTRKDSNSPADVLASRSLAHTTIDKLKDVAVDKVAQLAAKQTEQRQEFGLALSSSLAKSLATTEQTATATITQQTALANVPLSTNTLSPGTINAYPGREGWNAAISQKIVWMVGTAEQSATLTLNPPDLGPLQIVIHVHNNQADTTFLSDRQEVRQALEDGMSNLRDMMKEAGINLGDTNINQRNHPEQGSQQSEKSQNTMSPLASASLPESATWNVPLANVRTSKGLVDTFA